MTRPSDEASETRKVPFGRGLIRKEWLALSGIVLLALVLRLYRIDHQSVWHDEAFTITTSGMPLGPMTERIIRDFVHPPLHYFILHFWFVIFGFGALQARLVSVVFGTLSIVMIYLVANYLFGRRPGLLAALLLAVSQFGIVYSQEARPYAQFLFFALSSTYLFLLALREKRALAWWGFIASSVLMIYSHYYGAFVLACLLVFAVVFRSRYPVARLWWIGGALLMLALYMPWLTSGIVENVLESPKSAPPVLKSTLSVHWFSFASALNHFNNGKLFGVHERSPWWVYLTGGLLFTLPALIALRPLVTNRRPSPFDRRDKEATLLVALLWLLPLVAILGFGLLNIQYTVRYVVFCSAPYYVLIARGITGLGSPAMRRVWVVLILAYSVVSMRANYFVPYKENYRSAVNYLASHYSEEDCCIFFPVRTDRLPRYWTIYHRDHPGLRVANYDNIQRARTKCARVWLVVNKTWWWRWDREEYYEAQRKLDLTHSKVEEGRWSGMDFALYIPKPR